jgi:hypothetical protein
VFRTFILLSLFGISFSQEEEIELEDFIISVEPDKPRVEMVSTRERPEFPEVPIEKEFLTEIIDRNRIFVYPPDRKKLKLKLNINKEISELK